MKNVIHDFLTGLSRPTKRAILISIDLVIVLFCFYAAFALRFGTGIPFEYIGRSWVLLPLLLVACVVLSISLHLPSIKMNTFESTAVIRIGYCALGLVIFAMVSSYLLGLGAPRSVPIIFGVLFFFGATLVRQVGFFALNALPVGAGQRVPVAIYGAGAAGIQLVSALRQTKGLKPVTFVDDSRALQGLIVAGLKVEPPEVLQKLAAKGRIQRVLLAMPSISTSHREKLLKSLAALPLEVQVLPSFIEMLNGEGIERNLRTVSPDELLGRNKVNLSGLDISTAYAGRAAMVTGAGGSIGAELCRQLLNCGLKKLVLFEQNEFALYTIDQELRPLAQASGVEIIARLGSVTDSARVKSVMQSEGIHIVLHAAAYKHVPIVEENELEGARNNVLGTRVVAKIACELGIERFILISTDKAVRPANIMGATKRMAEMVVQDLQTRSQTTKLSMVRFGNVLGSSGSVLPLFQQQILSGGPVTVTHPDITRFFMAIPEAARLVLLAGAFAKGGDVFVLDMGQPMKIIDIAKRMIKLSGRTVKSTQAPEGDIELIITGLRPGEKLYEELLIDDETLKTTPHEKILRARDSTPSAPEIAQMLATLESALKARSEIQLRLLLAQWIDGYTTKP